jgi:hypothetical protein
MNTSLTLEQRIVGALANENAGSTELSELIIEVKAAVSAADQTAQDAHEQALDLTSSDIAAAEQAMAVAQLSGDRLHNALPRLQMKLSTALSAEQRDHWLEDFKRVKAKLDEAADMFAEYPELAARLVEIFRTAQAVDREVSRLNGAADGEHRRLKSVELEARGLDSFTRDNPSIAKMLQLPDWEQPSKLVWPPREASLAVQVAAGMAFSHPGGDWASEREQRTTALRADQERVAAYYEEMARQREERENAEAASRAAARRSGA